MPTRQERERSLRADRAWLTQYLAGMPFRIYTTADVAEFRRRRHAYEIARGRRSGSPVPD